MMLFNVDWSVSKTLLKKRKGTYIGGLFGCFIIPGFPVLPNAPLFFISFLPAALLFANSSRVLEAKVKTQKLWNFQRSETEFKKSGDPDRYTELGSIVAIWLLALLVVEHTSILRRGEAVKNTSLLIGKTSNSKCDLAGPSKILPYITPLSRDRAFS